MDQKNHRVTVRRKSEFLRCLMFEFAANSHISVEGDLSRCCFGADTLTTRDETPLLRRNTTSPKQDFVVLRLTPETVDEIFKQIMAAGLNRAIMHVQIERDGVLELGAYDNFDPECVVTGPNVSSAFLGRLKTANILRDFVVATEDRP
jgi:hypothetical protein